MEMTFLATPQIGSLMHITITFAIKANRRGWLRESHGCTCEKMPSESYRYSVLSLSSKELVKLDSVKVLSKVVYAKHRDEHNTVHSFSVLTTDDLGLRPEESFFQSFLPRSGAAHYSIFLRQEERGNDPVGFLLYSGQVAEDEAEAAFRNVTVTLAPILDAGYVTLNRELLKEIILPVPKEPEKLTFDIVALMRTQPRLYRDWIMLLQSLLEFASAKDDEKAVEALLKGADPNMPCGDGKCNLHQLVRQKSKVIATLVAHESTVATPSTASATLEQEKNENKGDGSTHHECRCGKTKVVRMLSYVKFKDLLNVFDSNNLTPLMLSVQDLQIDSTLQLLMGGADPNVPQPSTGDTALHMATQLGSVQLVKLIIAYGGGIDTLNRKSQTPIDIAKEQGNDEIVAVLEEVKAAEDIAKEAEGMDVKLAIEPDSLSLLSLDGGGMRSMMTAQVLLAIEKRMKALDPSCKSIMDYFDYVAGTSMGAAIAAAVVMGNHGLANAHKLIFTIGSKVLAGSKQSRVQDIESSLANLVGADTKMAQREKPRLIITAAMIDRSPCALHLFTNFSDSDNNQPSPEDQDVCGVLHATMAAPYYSPPYKRILADGGLAANNPTLAAMAKIFDQMEVEKKPQKLGCVVSLGTGDALPKPVSDIDVFIPSFTDALLRLHSKVTGFTNLVDMVTNKALESNGQQVIEAHAWCKSLKCPYFRLNPFLPKEISYDTSNSDDIATLMYTAHLYILEEASMIETIANALLSRKSLTSC